MTRRIVTVVATGELPDGMTADDLDAYVSDYLTGIGFALVPCDWAPDADTIGDCVDNPDGEDLPVHVTVIDLNPARGQ